MTEAATEATEADEYLVRAFRPRDREGFLDLHATVFGEERSRAWFAWKYEDNPYVDHVPMFVAERAGEIVGARPFFALRMSVDGEPHLALQPCDTMVHPEHRRQGLFSRMTEASIERYEHADASFFFNFPNDVSRPGYLKLGWEQVAEQSTYYRVQDPRSAASERAADGRAALAGTLAGPLVAGYNRLRDALSSPPTRFTIDAHDGVPAGTMATIADPGAPTGIRAHRGERFYDWRFDSPGWAYETYVASDRSGPAAALIAGTPAEPDADATSVTEVVAARRPAAEDAVEALLHRTVRDHPGAALISAPSVLPTSVLRGAGFHTDHRPPLSYLADHTTLVVRSLGGGWTRNGLDLADRENWHITFAERDTS